MQLNLESHKSLEDLRGFVGGSRDDSLLVPGRKAAHAQIGKLLRRFSYWKLGRYRHPDRSVIDEVVNRGKVFLHMSDQIHTGIWEEIPSI